MKQQVVTNKNSRQSKRASSQAGACIVEYLFLISFAAVFAIGGIESFQASLSSRIDQMLSMGSGTSEFRMPGGGGDTTGSTKRNWPGFSEGGGSDGTSRMGP